MTHNLVFRSLIETQNRSIERLRSPKKVSFRNKTRCPHRFPKMGL